MRVRNGVTFVGNQFAEIARSGFDPKVVRGKLRGGVKSALPESLTGSEETHYRYPGPETTIDFHVRGLGDRMMVRQIGRAYVDYLEQYGDPELGDLTWALGGGAPFLDIEPGDVNVYWWYSFNFYEDEPTQFTDRMIRDRLDFEPDVILCGSERIREEAERAGYDALFFPIGVHTGQFRPLGIDRRGLGYAGSKGHKDKDDVQLLMGEYMTRSDFQWVDDLRSPEQLNLWYNTRLATFGLTEPTQREWGVVNSRVFETLASGTPFVLQEHPTVDDVLGFEFPYQASTRAEAVDLVDDILTAPDEALAEFEGYAERVAAEHDYTDRIRTLVEYLS